MANVVTLRPKIGRMMYRDFWAADIPVFPIYRFFTSGKCECGKPDCEAVAKHPRPSNWQHTPIWDEEQIDNAESDGHYDTGYGVLCRGLLVIDVDARNGGVESHHKLLAAIPEIAGAGLAVTTGSGGGSQHLYFRAPEGVSFVTSHPDYPGIDFKSSGYVVGPGSAHKSGGIYTASGAVDEIDDAPPALVDLLKRPERHRSEFDGHAVDVTHEDLADILVHVPAMDNYAGWLSIGMALHHATQGTGLDLWLQWSAGSEFYDPNECLKKWGSFGKSTTPVTLGTLIHHAMQTGWTMPVTFSPDGGAFESFVAEVGDDPFDTVDAMDFDESRIPLRDWVIPGAILAKHTHIFAAPGGTGKSLFTLQLAMTLASGISWGQFHPRKPCRVLVLNAEDDIDEQRRRIAAAVRVMGITREQVGGRMLLAQNTSDMIVSKIDPRTKAQVSQPLAERLCAFIIANQIDVLIVDPFAETFEGDENDNSAIKWVMRTWRDEIARKTGCAVYLVHHTTKGASDKAGSTDAIRGAGAIVNNVRIASTLFGMTPAEADALGVKLEERIRYVRFDDAKANQSLISSRAWFEKVSVRLTNGDARYSEGWQSGDDVGALRPWSPTGFAGVSDADMRRFMESITAGFVDEDGICDQPWGFSKRGSTKRWVGFAIQAITGMDDKAAEKMITALKDRKIIYSAKMEDGKNGREVDGVAVNFERAVAAFGAPDPVSANA